MIRLAQIARESVKLARLEAELSEIHEILEKKWLKGAKNLGCEIIVYADKGFVNDKPGTQLIPAFLRRQLQTAFGNMADYRAGYTFTTNNTEIILIELEILTNTKQEQRIVAAYFVPRSEVDL